MSLPREWSFVQQEAPPAEVVPPSPALSQTAQATQVLVPLDVMSSSLLSVLSVQSAPALEAAPPRPRDLPAYLQSPPDEEEDHLLTISSLTGRPLLLPRRRVPPRAPDGGYGWLVVLGAFLVQFWVAGLVKSYGVLYVEVLESFPGSTAAVASWVPAILTCLCLALAPVSSALCQRFSCRAVVFAGGLCCSAGLACSYFATSLLHLLFTFGVLTGIGGGLSTTPGIVIVSQYFEKHRALANGICVSGTAAGSFVFPMVIERLVDRYGFHGTILLLGGGMLHVCVSAALYREPPPGPEPPAPMTSPATAEEARPPAVVVRRDNRLESLFPEGRQAERDLLLNQRNRLLAAELSLKVPGDRLIRDMFHPAPGPASEESLEGGDVLGEAGGWGGSLRATRSSSRLHSVEDLTTDSTCVYKARHRRRPLARPLRTELPAERPPPEPVPSVPLAPPPAEHQPTCMERITRYLDVSLLRDGRFMLVSGSVTLMSTGSPYLLYYLPAHTLAIGHSKSEAGSLVAVSAAMDLVGRLALGWLCDLQIFDRKKAYLLSVVFAGLSVLSLPLVTSWWLMALASGTYGLCLGCWFLLVPVLLTDLFGRERISSSYGLVRMFQSIGAISVPPLAGYVRDVTGGYSLCFYGMGSCMVLGALPMLAVASRVSRTPH